ncbi:hypothetical protein APS56_09305 [Pseudalgibacter alginicilyticus]|uniref:T9SS C-terminal target domain-containing protein n=1 Tax=Pseudalgibacter alginicilyticus TaxID=1736674 RepID=A0A0P0DBK0_9FLAO|nr:hypothetical protein [Pseudalgibacter alginicilyticus]ALJ05308.1 hypothetical protein APS56_09305 [Pseudalgibacter alginicilyticus]
MKKLNYLFISMLCLGLATGCSSSDDDNDVDDDENQNVITKSGILTANETWTADNIYLLDGKVVVNEDVILTIEAGTIIKGAEGLESLASALVVDQGGKIIANGTAAKPIIMTSELDNIAVGQTSGTNLNQEDVGLWGGLIILGRAPISESGDVQTAQIEGIPATEPYGQYGGTDEDDNSGVYKYISVRHGGITIGADNEINGVTMGGVGRGTTMDHIEVVANQDDGFEWFGGTVECTNFITWANGDDGLDADQAWSGYIDNAVVIQGTESGSAFELDGPEGSAATEDSYTMKNITLIGNSANNSKIVDARDGLLASLENILVYNFSSGATINFDDDQSIIELANDRLTFTSWEIVLPTGVATVSDLISVTVDPDDPNRITEVVNEAKVTNNVTAITSSSEATVGANTTVFGWTYAAAQNAF